MGKGGEATTDVDDKAREPLQKAKRESDDSEIVNMKKQKKAYEKPDLKKESDEDEKTALKETPKISFVLTQKEELEEHDCCFENEDAFRNHARTILVRGVDCSLNRDDIKSALKKHFGSCGEITRVFVPIECKTGSPIGFAFINLREDSKKALTLDGSYLGSQKLEVMMAIRKVEYYAYPNFRGCKRCHRILLNRRWDNFINTNGGRIEPWTAALLIKVEAEQTT